MTFINFVTFTFRTNVLANLLAVDTTSNISYFRADRFEYKDRLFLNSKPSCSLSNVVKV